MFRPKIDASLVFCLSQTSCPLSETDRPDLGRAFVKGPAFVPPTWADPRVVQPFLCLPSTCLDRSVFEAIGKAYVQLSRTTSLGVYSASGECPEVVLRPFKTPREEIGLEIITTKLTSFLFGVEDGDRRGTLTKTLSSFTSLVCFLWIFRISLVLKIWFQKLRVLHTSSWHVSLSVSLSLIKKLALILHSHVTLVNMMTIWNTCHEEKRKEYPSDNSQGLGSECLSKVNAACFV